MERRIAAVLRPALGRVALGVCLIFGSAQAQDSSLAGMAPPPAPGMGPVVAPPHREKSGAQSEAAEPVQARPDVEKGPERPERSPVAVLRVLDKITAETMQFAAPIGRRVRYRSLVFEVKACETWGAGSAEPRPSAYLIIQSDVGTGTAGSQQVKQIFKGWIFAQTPAAQALRHPIYDAWLVSCIASQPVS